MAVVLDAADYAPADRTEVILAAISGLAPAKVTLNAPSQSVTLRAEGWQLDSIYLLRVNGTGFRLTRTEQDVRREAPEIVVLAQTSGAGGLYTANGATQRLGHQDLHLCDLSGEYDYSQTQPYGGAVAAHVSYDQLGLPVDTVRAAVPRLRLSPVMPLLRGHMTALFAGVDDVAEDPATAKAVSLATIELIRAAVVSASADALERQVLHDTLRTRIVTHVQQHLQELDLTPARIAQEHNISLRTLYNVWGDQQESLAEWIMLQRLSRAARDLCDEDPRITVAAIAHRWGFADSTHFSRRFRAAFGTSPGNYRGAGHGQDRTIQPTRPFETS